MELDAIEGRRSNFSTAGQWLWDEIDVTVPAALTPTRWHNAFGRWWSGRPRRIRRRREEDWQRITQQYGTRAFWASCGPKAGGAGAGGACGRYIVRGPHRYEVKSKLFREMVGLFAAG